MIGKHIDLHCYAWPYGLKWCTSIMSVLNRRLPLLSLLLLSNNCLLYVLFFSCNKNCYSMLQSQCQTMRLYVFCPTFRWVYTGPSSWPWTIWLTCRMEFFLLAWPKSYGINFQKQSNMIHMVWYCVTCYSFCNSQTCFEQALIEEALICTLRKVAAKCSSKVLQKVAFCNTFELH